MESFEEFEALKKEADAKSKAFLQSIQTDKKIVSEEKEEKYAQIRALNEARRELAKECNELEAAYKEAFIKGKTTEADKIYKNLAAKKEEIARNLYDVEALQEYAENKVIKLNVWENDQNDFINLVAERYDLQAQLMEQRKEVEAQIEEAKKLLEEIKREESRILINPYSEETRAIVALYEESFGTIDTTGATISVAEAQFDFIRKDYRRIENMAQVIKVLEEKAREEAEIALVQSENE